jgi:NAD(P)-dependent dehydrogenase (short-subunit alcohol dehydrogenase family)
MQHARVAVVTGASSGIGLAAARTLASQGWRVIGTGRDPQRTAAAEVRIRAAAAPGVPVDMIKVDLSSMSETARAAREIAALTGHIDVLINNAGGTARERIVTDEGNEATFAGNHLGHFLLTDRLLRLLRVAASKSARGMTRIINVSSAAHHTAPGMNWDDLQMLKNFVPVAAYCNAKLANILFTRALAGRLAEDGIVVHAMHPGIVDSNFASHADESMQAYFRARNDLSSPEAASDTLAWLATAADAAATSGGYWHQRQLVAASDAAYDANTARRLWIESEKLTAAFR